MFQTIHGDFTFLHNKNCVSAGTAAAAVLVLNINVGMTALAETPQKNVVIFLFIFFVFTTFQATTNTSINKKNTKHLQL